MSEYHIYLLEVSRDDKADVAMTRNTLDICLISVYVCSSPIGLHIYEIGYALPPHAHEPKDDDPPAESRITKCALACTLTWFGSGAM